MPRLDAHRVSALVLLFTAGFFGAGCSGGQAPPPSPATAPASSTAPPSTTPSATVSQPAKYARTELAQRPCLALDARDLAALGIAGQGEEEATRNGPSCHWKLAGQNVDLQLDAPLSYAQTMTRNGRVTQVPVGPHMAVQAEFQRICFVFVAVDRPDHLVAATTIPDPGVPQDGTCRAGAAVAAAALTHLR
jgi:hypothetical protein